MITKLVRPRWFEHPTFGFGVPLGYSLILDESFSLSQKDNPTKVSQVIFNWNHIFLARVIIGNIECFLTLSVRKVYEILLIDLNILYSVNGGIKNIRRYLIILFYTYDMSSSFWGYVLCP